MADLICNFYYLHKRQNSTKKPADNSQLASYSINLKDNTSFLNPTIEVYLPNYDTPFGWNYAFISQFAKYYYIKDYRWSTSGYWEIDLTLDVLASHIAAIRAGTYFIKYAETAFNKWIIDTRVQQLTSCTTHITSGDNRIFDLDNMTDRNILFFISEDSNLSSGGALQAFLITQSDLKDVCQSLYTAGSGVWQDLQAQAGSASACIAKCIRVPYSVPAGNSLPIKLGNYSTGVDGRPVLGRVMLPATSISIPWQTNDYRRAYHKFTLVLPFVGAVSIEASDIINDSQIDIAAAIDILTGDVTYYVCHNSDAVAPIASYKCNCAQNLPISSYQSNTLGAVTSLANAGMAFATGELTAAASGVINAAANFCLSKSASVIGSQSGSAELMSTPTLITQYYPTCVAPTSISNSMGLPYFAENTLEGFSGFIQTENAHVAGGMLADERSLIESYLNTGIYLE